MIEIKICGITKMQEIYDLNKLQPDYIGFVFAESKRRVNKQQASILSESLNSKIKRVGVFRNNSIDEILDVINTVPLDIIQLHGEEDEAYIKILSHYLNDKIQIWKAIGINSETKLNRYHNYKVNALVLDNIKPGSGQVFNWDKVNQCNLNIQVFLAGGINEENVLQGIRAINPIGIDVSSGVETIDENGERTKSYIKMERLIRIVREIS